MTIRTILFASALIFLLQAVTCFVKYEGELTQGDHFGSDFFVFWRAARQADQGDTRAIYDTELLRQVNDNPKVFPKLMRAPFVNPPHMLLFTAPLGLLPYEPAVALWTAVPIVLYFLMVFLLLQREMRDEDRASYDRLALTVSGFLLPLLSVNVFSGQTATLIAVFFLAGIYGLKRHPVVAGIAFGLISIKPQFGILIPFALMAAGQWRAFAAAALTVIALSLFATLWLGPGIWSDYFHMTQMFGRYIANGSARFNQLAVSPYVSLHGTGFPLCVAEALQAVITLAAILITVHLFREPDSPLRAGLLAVAALLATPYGLCYDTPILASVLLPVLCRLWRNQAEPREIAVVFLLALMPYAQPIFYSFHIPLGLIVLLFTLAVLYPLRQVA